VIEKLSGICATINGHSKVRSNSLIHIMVPPHCNIKEVDNIARMNGERPHWTIPYICIVFLPGFQKGRAQFRILGFAPESSTLEPTCMSQEFP
jgi:hypothetical protein